MESASELLGRLRTLAQFAAGTVSQMEAYIQGTELPKFGTIERQAITQRLDQLVDQAKGIRKACE